MNNIWKVAKYQIYDSRKAVAIFYFVIFLIILVATIAYRSIGGRGTFGGFGMTTAIFIFVAGLNSFKADFKFMLANNVSRKKFFYGNIIALLTIAGFMAFVDSILSLILELIFPHESFFAQLYNQNNIFSEFLWSFGLYGLFIFLGWLITILYYRCNTIMKIIVSISPIAIIILVQYIGSQLQVSIGEKLLNSFGSLFSFTSNNPYAAVLSFIIMTAIVATISFSLIRRAPIKE